MNIAVSLNIVVKRRVSNACCCCLSCGARVGKKILGGCRLKSGVFPPPLVFFRSDWRLSVNGLCLALSQQSKR